MSSLVLVPWLVSVRRTLGWFRVRVTYIVRPHDCARPGAVAHLPTIVCCCVQPGTEQNSTVLYCTVLHCTVLYSSIQYLLFVANIFISASAIRVSRCCTNPNPNPKKKCYAAAGWKLEMMTGCPLCDLDYFQAWCFFASFDVVVVSVSGKRRWSAPVWWCGCRLRAPTWDLASIALVWRLASGRRLRWSAATSEDEEPLVSILWNDISYKAWSPLISISSDVLFFTNPASNINGVFAFWATTCSHSMNRADEETRWPTRSCYFVFSSLLFSSLLLSRLHFSSPLLSSPLLWSRFEIVFEGAGFEEVPLDETNLLVRIE